VVVVVVVVERKGAIASGKSTLGKVLERNYNYRRQNNLHL
jgi:hypothetical protein